MDPNVTLAALREAVNMLLNGTNAEVECVDIQLLAEHFDALDQWLSKGGFPPEDWSR